MTGTQLMQASLAEAREDNRELACHDRLDALLQRDRDLRFCRWLDLDINVPRVRQ